MATHTVVTCDVCGVALTRRRRVKLLGSGGAVEDRVVDLCQEHYEQVEQALVPVAEPVGQPEVFT